MPGAGAPNPIAPDAPMGFIGVGFFIGCGLGAEAPIGELAMLEPESPMELCMGVGWAFILSELPDPSAPPLAPCAWAIPAPIASAPASASAALARCVFRFMSPPSLSLLGQIGARRALHCAQRAKFCAGDGPLESYAARFPFPWPWSRRCWPPSVRLADGTDAASMPLGGIFHRCAHCKALCGSSLADSSGKIARCVVFSPLFSPLGAVFSFKALLLGLASCEAPLEALK